MIIDEGTTSLRLMVFQFQRVYDPFPSKQKVLFKVPNHFQSVSLVRSSSCSTSDIRRVAHAKHPMTSHEQGTKKQDCDYYQQYMCSHRIQSEVLFPALSLIFLNFYRYKNVKPKGRS
jgi:hypothetical protein